MRSCGKTYNKHTSVHKQEKTPILSESNRGMTVLDRDFNLCLILPQVTEDGRILPRIFSPGLKKWEKCLFCPLQRWIVFIMVAIDVNTYMILWNTHRSIPSSNNWCLYVHIYTYVHVSGSQSPPLGTSVFHATHITVTDSFSLQMNRFGSANQAALTKVEEFSCLKIQLLSTPSKPSSTGLRNTCSVRGCCTGLPRHE